MSNFNESTIAAARDAERAIAARAEPPVNLRKLWFAGAADPEGDLRGNLTCRLLPIPTFQLAPIPLEDFIDHDVSLAPAVREYLETRKHFSEVGPFLEGEVEALESAMEIYHGVNEPYYIHMSLALQQLGRSWQFEEAAGQFLTGFTLGKE